MSDSTEAVRRELVAEINLVPGSREALEAEHGQVWNTDEMSEEFEAPIGTIKRRLHVARKRLAAALDEEMSEELVAV